jgi:hypothetical protein
MLLTEYHRVQEHREALVRVVHAEVQRYFDDPALVCDDGRVSFPGRDRLSGEYYVAHESYTQHAGPVWIQIGVMCHCLEKMDGHGGADRDYLGLEVWLRCDPQDWTFEIFRNTDSSSL